MKIVVVRSSAEAEFRAMTLGNCELLWMKLVLENLKINCEGPMKLFCDNKPVIGIAHDLVHITGQHIEIIQHLKKENLDSELITTTCIPLGHWLIVVLTKGLPTERFSQLTCNL